ncbi:hypothetical protein JCM10212_003196 [Sporobolomyces blumeae]
MLTPQLASPSTTPRQRTRTKSSTSTTKRTSSTPVPTPRPTNRPQLEEGEAAWSTDDDDEVRRRPSSRPRNVPRQRNERPRRRSCVPSLVGSLVRSLVVPVLPCAIGFAALYLFVLYARSTLSSYLSLVLPQSLEIPLARLANVSLSFPRGVASSLAPLTSLSCATIGVGCRPNLNLVSTAARSASVRARHALTVFDHLVALSNDHDASATGAGGGGLALHPVEIWELSTAIRYSSQIDDREFVSNELAQLGDAVRDVKDSVILLNAQGMNAFTWIVHEFTRLEELIARAASAPTRSTKQEADLTRLLEALFDKIARSLADLLAALDRAIPAATLASDRSRRIFGTLRAGEAETERELRDESWTEWMRSVRGSKGRQLRRDLELTRGSAEAVVGVWQALEGTRESLVGYRNNVGFFKAGVVGYHLSGTELSVEDEVNSLKQIMDEMKQTLREARGRHAAGRSGHPRRTHATHELPPAP